MELLNASYISQLNISINMLGDINKQINIFNPKMVYQYSRENVVLFVPTIPITMNTLINSNVGIMKETYRPSDFIPVFSNHQLLNKVIEYSIKKQKIKPVTTDEAEKKEIVKKNIELILSIYFDSVNTFIINYTRFPIHSYKWDGKFESKALPNKKIPFYTINIDLYVLDNRKSGNSNERNELTCNIKHMNIIKDLNELGFNLDIPSISTIQNTIPYGSYIRGNYTDYNTPIASTRKRLLKSNQYPEYIQRRQNIKKPILHKRGGKRKKKTVKKTRKYYH